jgi:Cu+-exporting ATPase
MHERTGQHEHRPEGGAPMGTDPVCGMTVSLASEVLPDQKVDVVKRLQSEGRFVGTDVAMESASVTLVKGDFRGIVRALRLSRKTMRNIQQNLCFAFVYNCAGVPIAAGVLYPFFGLLLSPIIAEAAMSFSSVSVVSNALRLRCANV